RRRSGQLTACETSPCQPVADRGEEAWVEAGRSRQAREEACWKDERGVGRLQDDGAVVVVGLERGEAVEAELGRDVAVVRAVEPEGRDVELAEVRERVEAGRA